MKELAFCSLPNIVLPTGYSGILALREGRSWASMVVHVVFSKEQAVACAQELVDREAVTVINLATVSKLPAESDRKPLQVDGFPAYHLVVLMQVAATAPDDWKMVALLDDRPCSLALSTDAALSLHELRPDQHGFALLCMTPHGAEAHLGFSRSDALGLIYARRHLPMWSAAAERMCEAVITSALPEISERGTVVVDGSSALNLLRAELIATRKHPAARRH